MCEKFARICHICEEFVRIFHMCDKYVRILHNVWQIRSNVKVQRICHKCENFERICHTWRICATFSQTWQIRVNPLLLWRTRTNFSDVTNTCESFTSVKDSHESFTSAIGSHDMSDKFIEKSICNAFISRPPTPQAQHCVVKRNMLRRHPVVLKETRTESGRHEGECHGWTGIYSVPALNMKNRGVSGNPLFIVPINVSLIWSQILNYTAEIHFVPEQGW